MPHLGEPTPFSILWKRERLASSNPSVAAVPSSVAVPAGASSAGFTVTTSPVASPTSATVSAAAAGATRTASLGVSPAAGPLPAPSLLSPGNDARLTAGRTVAFDWTDVPGAASFTIVIDDADTFASPIVNQVVASSGLSIATLPARKMWWRVRSNDGSGTPGAWSAVRRFELRN